MRREKMWLYPFEAVRETVINALAHRDWTRFVDIEVTAYADRLEVISPGAFQNSMTVEKMKAGQRSARNPIIVEVLRDYGYVDARGMGVRTKVIPLMRRHVGVEPQFEATEDFVRTVLAKIKRHLAPVDAPLSGVSGGEVGQKGHAAASSTAPLTPLQGQLLELIRGNPGISYDELAAISGKDRTTVRRNIQKMKKLGRIQRLGSKKTGHWEVIE
jgi:ATP-dependent DNA helicase RecG